MDLASLKKTNTELEIRIENLKKSFEITFKLKDFPFESKINDIYVLYYPKSSCSHCFQMTLLSIDSSYVKITDNLLIYLDDKSSAEIISSFNDAYGTKYRYTVGDTIFDDKFDKIVLFKLVKGVVKGALIIPPNDMGYFIDILKLSS